MARVINNDPPGTPDEPMVWEPLSPEESEEMERAELAQKPWLRAAAPPTTASPPAPIVPPPPPIHSSSLLKPPPPMRRIVDGIAPARPGRTPANGLTPRRVTVASVLTDVEVEHLDRWRRLTSRADALARMSGLRREGFRGWASPIGESGLTLERHDLCFRLTRGDEVVVEFAIADWVKAVLSSSRGAGDR